MDDADFADDGYDGFGGFDLDLGQVAAFGDLLAGFVGPVPQKMIGSQMTAVLAGGKRPLAYAESHEVIERHLNRNVLLEPVSDLCLPLDPSLARIERIGSVADVGDERLRKLHNGM